MGFAQSRIPNIGIQTDVVPISRQRKISQNVPLSTGRRGQPGPVITLFLSILTPARRPAAFSEICYRFQLLLLCHYCLRAHIFPKELPVSGVSFPTSARKDSSAVCVHASSFPCAASCVILTLSLAYRFSSEISCTASFTRDGIVVIYPFAGSPFMDRTRSFSPPSFR